MTTPARPATSIRRRSASHCWRGWRWRGYGGGHGGRAGRAAIIGLVVALVLVNALPVRIMAQSRTRDSLLRVAMLAEVRARVPAPRPGERICLLGLPEHLRDVAWALPVIYGMPVVGVTEDDAGAAPCEYVIDLGDWLMERGP